ncbi:MAG: site-2 protease family protein [Patescibacteria group bacterium]
MELIFIIVVLIFSVVIHEVSHGYMAERLGDNTARLAGRLTLNPIKHLDPVGSFLVPAVLAYLGGVVFGWARPVPYNPRNLRNLRRDEALVAAAGPISNIIISVAFALIYRNILDVSLFVIIIQINLSLAVFNLIPIPPLDGSKIFFALLPQRGLFLEIRNALEGQWFIILLLIIFLGLDFVSWVIFMVYRLLMGEMGL